MQANLKSYTSQNFDIWFSRHDTVSKIRLAMQVSIILVLDLFAISFDMGVDDIHILHIGGVSSQEILTT